jgi:hypothetical protein
VGCVCHRGIVAAMVPSTAHVDVRTGVDLLAAESAIQVKTQGEHEAQLSTSYLVGNATC